MFRIYDGRTEFYQWDTNQKLIVEDSDIKEVHFANCLCPNAHVVETYTEGELTLADVPNILFQEHLDINVYAYDGKKTKHAERFEVNKRTKPADYVYTETEEKSFDNLQAKLEELYIVCREMLYTFEDAIMDLQERVAALEALNQVVFYINDEEYQVNPGTTWEEAMESGVFDTIYCHSCEEHKGEIVLVELGDSLYYVASWKGNGDYCPECDGDVYILIGEDDSQVTASDIIQPWNYWYEME